MDTPNFIYQNENLTPSEQNIQQNMNVSQFFIEKDFQSSKKESNKFVIKFPLCNCLVYFLSIIILLVFIIPAMVIPRLDLSIKISFISSGVIFSLILMIFCVNKIILVKDIPNRNVLIKVINYLCFPKIKLNFDIENTHLYVMREISQSENGIKEDFTLLIINDYKNLVGIDLDTTNIKQKPAKFFYSFKNISTGKYNYTGFTQALKNFIGSSTIHENSLFFNNNEYLSETDLSNYMKFSGHFSTLHLKNPLKTSCFGICFIIIALFVNLITISAAVALLVSINAKTHTKIIGIIFFPIGNILLYILYILYNCFDHIFRIDCIYSKNFDRIFIGLVKNNIAKYINTFEYQINNISKFIFERVGNSSVTNYDLKVIFKNNEIQRICTIKNKAHMELESLAYLLNERLNKYS